MEIDKNYLEVLEKRAQLSKAQKVQATRHQELAVKIAERFHDMKSLGIFLRLCKKYPEAKIRRCMEQAQGKDNPGRYFVWLMHHT